MAKENKEDPLRKYGYRTGVPADDVLRSIPLPASPDQAASSEPKPSFWKQFTWDDVVVAVVVHSIAEPINIAAGEAFVNLQTGREWAGWAYGIPLAVIGTTFHWWKRWILPASVPAWIGKNGGWLVFIALLAASGAVFAYVSGPVIYQRATAPTLHDGEAAFASQKATLIEWLKQAQRERDQAIVERNAAQRSWADEIKTREGIQSRLNAAQQELDQTARANALSSSPLSLLGTSTLPTVSPPPETVLISSATLYYDKDTDSLTLMSKGDQLRNVNIEQEKGTLRTTGLPIFYVTFWFKNGTGPFQIDANGSLASGLELFPRNRYSYAIEENNGSWVKLTFNFFENADKFLLLRSDYIHVNFYKPKT